MAGKERLEDGRMVIRHPSGKVELVASEQERLAQLGARVLEILKVGHGGMSALCRDSAFLDIESAARSLGLLDEPAGKRAADINSAVADVLRRRLGEEGGRS